MDDGRHSGRRGLREMIKAATGLLIWPTPAVSDDRARPLETLTAEYAEAFRRKATSLPTQTLTRAATASACRADVGRYANFTVRVATTLPSTSMLNTTRPRPSWRSARLDR